jgi:hypothetical protein
MNPPQKKCRIPRAKISLLDQLEKENLTYHSAQENFDQLLQIYLNWLVNLVRIRIFLPMFLRLQLTFFRKKKFLLFNGIVDEVHVDGDGVDRGDAVLDPAQHTQTTQLPLLTFQAFSFFVCCLRIIVLVLGLSFVKITTTSIQLFIEFKLLYCKHFLLLSVLSV